MAYWLMKSEPSAWSWDQQVKAGAKVMLLRNDSERRWVNGTIARISRLDEKRVWIEVDGKEHEVGDTASVREAIAAVVPGFEEIGRIDKTKQEFHVGGRTFHTPTFAMADGRASLHVHDLPKLQEDFGVLRLMTVRSEGQFNTVVYEDHDLYRGVEGRDVILLHPQDIERLGLRGDQRVTVHSETSSMPEIRVIPFDRIRAGNALMYYPEANVLVARSLDPRSKTPAFKNVLVRVEADRAATIR